MTVIKKKKKHLVFFKDENQEITHWIHTDYPEKIVSKKDWTMIRDSEAIPEGFPGSSFILKAGKRKYVKVLC